MSKSPNQCHVQGIHVPRVNSRYEDPILIYEI